MPRSKADWDAWFARREGKQTYSKGTKKVKKLPATQTGRRASVIGERSYQEHVFQRSHIEKYADYRRANPTPAEAEFQRFLNELNGGALRRKFVREHVISGKWIVDFFFPDIRLAVEIDGSIHLTGIQKNKDKMKDADAKRFDITVLRLTNSEVAGNKQRLTVKLREAWRSALQRENQIIGKPYYGQKLPE
ncbi:endonuclease domain-containing protein [Seohaeicola saemankumensis]|uniref:Endonuclease domain-containing protein n=1 Tax=Seohaeicola saemankumensis TaxID=481181 RepID=A0ABW3TD44_9RHOB